MKRIELLTGIGQEDLNKIDTIKESGFFDLPVIKKCNHPEHNPPSHINIPYGKGYKHVCPSCKAVSIIVPPQATCCYGG